MSLEITAEQISVKSHDDACIIEEFQFLAREPFIIYKLMHGFKDDNITASSPEPIPQARLLS